MIYVFDTSSIRSLQHFYPSVFKTIWDGLDGLVKQHKQLFTTPNSAELQFVAQIFQINHFQSLIGEQQRLKGAPVADPFVIACARIKAGTVVTEEQLKPNAAKIPNVCAYFKVPCIDLERFMQQQGWTF